MEFIKANIREVHENIKRIVPFYDSFSYLEKCRDRFCNFNLYLEINGLYYLLNDIIRNVEFETKTYIIDNKYVVREALPDEVNELNIIKKKFMPFTNIEDHTFLFNIIYSRDRINDLKIILLRIYELNKDKKEIIPYYKKQQMLQVYQLIIH